MFLKFANRKEEKEFLEERHQKRGFEFFVVYGRRRVGKTELVKEFIRQKPHLYFLCDQGGTASNFIRFKKKIGEFLGELPPASEDWEEVFAHFVKRVKEKGIKKPVIVFDEFSFLVEKDRAVPSFFQRVVDEVLKKEDIMLILLGSSISMMEKGVLSSKSPLYGRKTAHLKVEPIRFSHYPLFFPSNYFKKNMEFHSVLGGVPFYLVQFSESKSVLDNIAEEILSRKGHLYEEVDFLLREEFREPVVYRRILEAIGAGSQKLAGIANKSGIAVQDMDRYLKSLANVGLVKKELKATEKKSKKTAYFIEDNFFRFWFYFCEPLKSDLAIGELSLIKEKLQSDFNQFVSKCFEDLIRKEFLKIIFPKLVKRGRWWGHRREGEERKEMEIDIVALNEETTEILFGECKWQEKVDARRVLAELKEKAVYVEWNKQQRKETYALFAKSFKEKIKEPGLFLFDSEDLEKCSKKE